MKPIKLKQDMEKYGDIRCCEKCLGMTVDGSHYCQNLVCCFCHIEQARTSTENTNTLREEFNTFTTSQKANFGELIERDTADFFINKFNQKLEEIEREIEKERINIYPSNNVENY
jgi:hypothetical protein